MTFKLVGYKKFKSKKGDDCLVIELIKPFTTREIDFGACGSSVVEKFIPNDFSDKFVPAVIGKNIDLEIEVNSYNGKTFENVTDLRFS